MERKMAYPLSGAVAILGEAYWLHSVPRIPGGPWEYFGFPALGLIRPVLLSYWKGSPGPRELGGAR